ncbi:MAG: VanW family protein [Armatimonadota bacterium]|nr:VanW family protein [Armatimonadota bacterium]MDW8156731.1 VanW family protein [Armatimonadota bacterium]
MRSVLWVAAALAAALGAAATWDHVRHAGRVLPGVWVDGAPAGGMTPAQLGERLARSARAELSRPVQVRAGSRRWVVRAWQLGLQVDVEEGVRRAYLVGREGTWWSRVRQRWRLWRAAVEVEVPRRVEGRRQRAFLDRVSREVDVPAQDARLVVASGRVEVVPGRAGLAVDIPAAEERLRNALLLPVAEVELPVRRVEPRWTAERLVALGISQPVASFTTHFSGDPDRAHNVALAASRLRGVLLPTGSELSFNALVGPRTQAAGFRQAPVLVEDELVPGDGGGVCQVSTTVFNAALLADLEVRQRVNHTQPVPYVPVGRDATVVYPSVDLRVRNPGPPLLLWTEVTGDRLTVTFYGPVRPRRRVKVLVTDVQVIPPPGGHVVRADPDLPVGRWRVLPARPGYRATTVREVWESGRLVRREVVARSVYRPVPRTVRVGDRPTAGSAQLQGRRP